MCPETATDRCGLDSMRFVRVTSSRAAARESADMSRGVADATRDDGARASSARASEGQNQMQHQNQMQNQNPMDLMRRAEREMEENAARRARRGYAMDEYSVVYGAAKPGEDEWGRRAREGDEDGDASAAAASRDSDVDDEDDERDDDEDAVIADEEFKAGVRALKRGDLNEALRRFVYAESCCPRSMTEAKEKLLKTIAQTRALLEQEDEDEGDDSEFVSRDDDEFDDSRDFDDEFHDAEGVDSEAGWSDTDASLADDAYRTAVWLLKSAADEHKPADTEKIRDLLERARQFCPPAASEALHRIDDLLARLDVEV